MINEEKKAIISDNNDNKNDDTIPENDSISITSTSSGILETHGITLKTHVNHKSYIKYNINQKPIILKNNDNSETNNNNNNNTNNNNNNSNHNNSNNNNNNTSTNHNNHNNDYDSDSSDSSTSGSISYPATDMKYGDYTNNEGDGIGYPSDNDTIYPPNIINTNAHNINSYIGQSGHSGQLKPNKLAIAIFVFYVLCVYRYILEY